MWYATPVIELHDPDFYRRPDAHERLAELRLTQPVHWVDESAGPGYWAVLRHADIVQASRHPEVFSSSLGGMILEDSDPEILEQSRRMLVVMDPPKHSVPPSARAALRGPGHHDDGAAGACPVPHADRRRARQG